MAVCGPSCFGKTELKFQMLLRNTFYPNFSSIYYFYQHEQPKFSTIERKVNIFFTNFSGFEFISQLENCLLAFDDSCEEVFNDKEFSKLATAGRHKNISEIFVKHNLIQQSKWSRIIDLNTTHIILLKSPRDIQQITYVGKQLNNKNFLKESYELETKQPFGHSLNDLDPKTSDSLRYCSNIVQPGPTIFYLPSSKAVITTLTDERERAMCAKAITRAAQEQFEKVPKTSTK